MAALVLGAVGSAIGGGFGGAILGFSGAAIGGFVGAAVGSVVDAWIVQSLTPNQRIEGARLESLRITSATEGAIIAQVFGRMRIGGNIIWATDFTETFSSETQGGGKGGGGGVTTTTALYSASLAIAICEGPITGIGRIWADGDPMDMTGVVMRTYLGNEAQNADPLIVSLNSADGAPAYRGTAYVVFENLPLANYGNRVPQITFEIFRPLATSDSAEGLVQGVTIIPASGEFAYATTLIPQNQGSGFGLIPAGTGKLQNSNAIEGRTDIDVSLDRLEALAPAVSEASLVVSWFANDLRAGVCEIRPRVERTDKSTTPQWEVNGLLRASAQVVSQIAGRPAFGGTPTDASVVEAIVELKARGKTVTLYPFLMVDVAAANTLPNPYSNNAATIGQPIYPWRGRITCSPAAGFTGTVDKTAAAATQVAAFFGAATAGNFSVVGTKVSWTGSGSEWGFRRHILHYAHLCAAAGGVDAFLIATEMRGLTTIRSAAGTYPAVTALRTLAADVSAILGAATKVSYAADWSEYFGHQPGDASNDVYFHLDPLWSDANVDFIGIDNYMPLSDWRDGFTHADALLWPSIYDKKYLAANIAGGEGFDWFYANDLNRANQVRTPITDGLGKPWVFRYKDLRNWWTNQHFNRPLGVESVSPTGWVPQSKPFRFTELGCPCVDRGTNQPNVFVDPKSSESFYPYFSRGTRDDAISRCYLEATYSFWNTPANNPISVVYSAPMLEVGKSAVWTWDARPYPWFPELAEVWTDGVNWRLGHWLTGRLGAVSLGALVKHFCMRAGFPEALIDVSDLYGAVEGYAIASIESPRTSISVLARHFGFDAVETEGSIRFSMRGRLPIATILPDDMIAGTDAKAEMFELMRSQTTDLPLSLKWSLVRADADYDSVVVEARRINVDSLRIGSESFPLAVPPEEAERRCRRALLEAWVGIESLTFALPPSRLALDPNDVVLFEHDGRQTEFRLGQISDAVDRKVESTRQDRLAYDLPPGTARPNTLRAPTSFGTPEVIFMNLPQLIETTPAFEPYVAVNASPWPGSVISFRSPTLDGFLPAATINRRASTGLTNGPFFRGPYSVFDRANTLEVTLASGVLASVTDIALFAGANAFAIESSPGEWEIFQAGDCTLIGPQQYRLSRLLRGQKGTEGKMGNPTPAGARFVVLDLGVYPIKITESEVGLPFNWRTGPAGRPVNDPSYAAQTFTASGEGLKPYAPDMIRQPFRTARLPGDYLIEWIRRDRAMSADAWDFGEPPMSETLESYEVEIMSGASVLRLLTSSVQSVLYTSAMQTTDWGAPLAISQSLSVRIFQISARLGRGSRFATTLFF